MYSSTLSWTWRYKGCMSAPCHGCFTPEKDPVHTVQEAGWALPGIEHRTVQPVARQYTEWAIPGLTSSIPSTKCSDTMDRYNNEQRIFRIINLWFWNANFYLSLIIQLHNVLISSLSYTSATNLYLAQCRERSSVLNTYNETVGT
jgi:hypothetical protein